MYFRYCKCNINIADALWSIHTNMTKIYKSFDTKMTKKDNHVFRHGYKNIFVFMAVNRTI